MKRNHKIAIAAALALSVIAVGGAVGATKLTPEQESEAIINDAAEQLGVQPSELSNALKQALKNRVDAAVRAGRLSEEEGQRLKEQIDENEMPFFGLGPKLDRHHDGPFHGPAKLEGAAEYLGMTEAQLLEALEDGKTLAQVARDRGKSVEGLVDKLAEYAEQKLSNAVEEGRLTEAEKNEMLEGLRARLRDMVNGRFPAHPGPSFHRERVEAPGAPFSPGTF